MARRDAENRAKFWVDDDLGGVSLMRAAYGTLSFAPHVHDELVVAITESGAGRCVTRGVSDIGTSRSIMVFNPGEPHSGGVAGALGWRYRSLYVGGTALTRLSQSLGQPPATLPYFCGSVVTDPDLASLLVRAHLALEERDARLVRETLFLGGLAKLFARHGRPTLSSPAVGSEQAPIRRALDCMRTRFAEDITIGELAACAAMSPFHFARSFHKVTGLPPHAYLTQLRLDHARHLLGAGQPPADTALAVGFYDQSHLIRQFKRTYGITPGQYAAAFVRRARA